MCLVDLSGTHSLALESGAEVDCPSIESPHLCPPSITVLEGGPLALSCRHGAAPSHCRRLKVARIGSATLLQWKAGAANSRDITGIGDSLVEICRYRRTLATRLIAVGFLGSGFLRSASDNGWQQIVYAANLITDFPCAFGGLEAEQ